MKVLRIDLNANSLRTEEIPAQGPITLGIKIHNEAKSWSLDPLDPNVPFIIGMGPFVGGKMPGFHRLIAVFKSPMTRTLHVAALGGAAYKFMGSGIDTIVITGKSKKPIVIFASSDGIELRNIEPVFEYGNYHGAYAFTKYLLDTYRDFFVKYNARAVVVGPAALGTYNGALVSIDVNPLKGEFRPGAEDFAARGGPGTALVMGHNVVGIVAGGTYKARYTKVNDMDFINKIMIESFKKPFRQVMDEKTIKYRFDPSIGTGGTFGVNYPHYRELLPLFGYKSIYLPREVRIQHVEAILRLFWKPFNDEVFVKSKSWYNCGDFGCSVVCKKVWRGKKVDYEPFHAMGPFIGNYIFEEAVPLVDLIDQYGLDAIEMGHVVAWVFDAIEHGLLRPDETGLSDKPAFDPVRFNPDVDSRKNARLAGEVIKGFVEKSSEILKLIAENGVRVAARKLDEIFHDRVLKIGKSFRDLVVYVAYGNEGYMTPNFYWAPGMVAPMYMLGRYWTNYTPTFMGPEDFAKSSLNRAIAEALIDDSGLCRFHRGWAEPVLDRLYIEITGMQPNKDIYKELAEYSIRANTEPKPWEGERARDVVSTMAREVGSKEWSFEDYEDYINWWRRFKETIDSGLGLTPLITA
ncbi:glyceraldehyde-3-phosphate:ferredoxin oxidoreductase (GAPOR) [Vulcanisaeta moutnovskia 768-28]|uniref:Glyceraldehyde-3-phosphate:ferredoxin oxidoreductase (GAPOR) n=1 Tax=Vulcanisaeta moutnovskia (strain 768-28) TaxID=985053 RepID=F0QWW3_VULM7|nr:aldehyde ferredoxin oxidoreductase N-terminal domain-containing protein [Vulcanisaeta moutnovskia]ADY01081.1 glyceraldehyde-3-phosphate:ferredoxin oxidoreductase (GAPOR) [Vulcanisaeta moutnovskia 768-28]